MKKILAFSATWCGPCKIQKGILEKFSKENGIELRYIDIDDNPDLVEKYNIGAVPTTVYLEQGKPDKTFIGLQSETVLKKNIFS